MRRVRYSVAMSLDGFIAGPKGEYDWIVRDPEIDFQALFAAFDTVLIGRRSFEIAAGQGDAGPMMGMKTYLFSRTLTVSPHKDITLVGDGAEQTVADLKQAPGKDIWLFGGGELFRSLLAMHLEDSVEVAVIPVLLGGGIPLLPSPAPQTKLKLVKHTLYKTSGIVGLEYGVERKTS